MKALRFVFLFLLPGPSLTAQPAGLYKFRQERAAPDREVYVYEGMQDEHGKVVIPAHYDYIWEFGKDTFTLARKMSWNADHRAMVYTYQVVTQSGFLSYEFPHYLVPEPFSEGLSRCYNNRNRRFGFVDMEGNVKIKFRYTDAGDFSEGLAMVEDQGKILKGFIDKKGKYLVQPRFDEAFAFSEGQAVVKQNARFFYCGKDGQLSPIPGAYNHVFDLREGFSVVIRRAGRDSVLYGIIDKNGAPVVIPRYEFIDNYEMGTAVFLENGKAGMLNTKGEIIIAPRYEELYRFDQLHYLFQQNGLKGLLRLDGSQVIPAQYSAIDYYREGLCAVQRSGKWGFADTAGNEVIPCQFAGYREGFKEGRVSVLLGDKWWVAHQGDSLSLPDYEEVLPYYGQTAAFRKEGLWGFLNTEGEESIEPRFDELVYNKGSIIFGSVAQADSNVRWSVISPAGKETVSARYIDVVRYAEGFAAVKTDKGWGFIDESGKEIVSPQYEAVRNFSSGRAAVMKNGNWGFINAAGKEIVSVYTGSSMSGHPDTVQQIRRSFPLYGVQVTGDFDGNCACVEDETHENKGSPPGLCFDKTGVITEEECTPLDRYADSFEEAKERNAAYSIIRLPGRWITIDKAGMIVN